MISRTEHNTVVRVGNIELTLLHTPGHTPGSQCVYAAIGRLVLTGDTLFIGSCGRLDQPDCDKAAMYTSLQKVLGSLPPDTKVCVCYTPVTPVMDLLTSQFSSLNF
jgi:glyoxylase-like metal-dependent hydrolase (beta-lactamase superfamily II)